jgi:hypothetical protein
MMGLLVPLIATAVPDRRVPTEVESAAREKVW